MLVLKLEYLLLHEWFKGTGTEGKLVWWLTGLVRIFG